MTVFKGEHIDEITLERHDDTDCLHDRKHNGNDSRDLGEFLSALFALFGHLLQRRNNQREKLHDNRRVDKRQHAESEQGCVLHRSAGNDVEDAQKVTCKCAIRLHLRNVECRDRDIASDSIDEDKSEGNPYLHSYFLRLECVFESLKHYSTSVVPPAFSIFSIADAVNLLALIVSFFSSSPLPRTLSP